MPQWLNGLGGVTWGPPSASRHHHCRELPPSWGRVAIGENVENIKCPYLKSSFVCYYIYFSIPEMKTTQRKVKHCYYLGRD